VFESLISHTFLFYFRFRRDVEPKLKILVLLTLLLKNFYYGERLALVLRLSPSTSFLFRLKHEGEAGSCPALLLLTLFKNLYFIYLKVNLNLNWEPYLRT